MGQWSLIGREAELKVVREIVAGHASHSGVLIVGPAGVGKTRLAEEAVVGLGRRRVVTLVGTIAARDVPLAALLAVYPDIDAWPERGIAEAHARLAGQASPLVLLVDDCQWLDESTQALLHLLVSRRRARVVATAREDMSIPPTILDLWKDGHLDRIDLAALDAADSGRLVAAILGAPAEAAVVAELYRRSDGLPLALRELVTQAVTSRAVVVRDGVGRAVEPLPAPVRLLEVIAGNLERLQPSWRDILSVVASAEPVPMDLLLGVVDEAHLTAAEKEGLVRVSRPQHAGAVGHLVTAGHPLYGEAALAATTPLGRHRIIERLVDAAQRLPGAGDALALRLAAWCLEIGRPVPIPDLLRATRLTQLAIDVDRSVEVARELWRRQPAFDTGMLYATTLNRQQRHEAAYQVLGSMSALDLTENERVGRVSLANEVLTRLHRHDDAVDELRQAEEEVQSRQARAHLHARRAFTINLSGDPRAAWDIIRSLVDSGDQEEFREAMPFAPTILGLDGRAEEALDLVGRLDHDPGMSFNRGASLYFAGRLSEAHQEAVRGLRAAEESGLGYHIAGWLNLLGRTELDRGHPASAALSLGRVVSRFPGVSGGAQRAIALNALVEAHALLGQPPLAREAMTALRQNPGSVLWHPAGLAQLSEGYLAHSEGNVAAAMELFAEGYRRAEPVNASVALTAAHTLSRYGQRRLGLDLALALPQVQGPLAPLRVAHMRALATADAIALSDVAVHFEQIGADLFAAEAYAAAAAQAARAGETRRATAARRAGRAILPRLQGTLTPDLVELPREDGASLTPRERQVAVLAARGTSSRAIAAALMLSVRTVDNTLASVYRKLGVTGRQELRQLLLD